MIYLSFSINSITYAVPVKYISESIQCSHITRIPKLPKFVLGVMNLRGKIVPVMDTRIRMGLKSKMEERLELVELLKKREQEHIHWLRTLESEVIKGNEISVQRNPSMCNFGKWYQPYMQKLIDDQTRYGNVDNVLFSILRSFDEPHQRIHAIANQADELVKQGRKSEATELIKETKETELVKMIDLFKNLYEAIDDQQKRDIVVILQKEDQLFGITVDAIDSTVEIENLEEAPIQTDLVQQLCILNDQAIQILNLESFTELARQAA